MSKALLFVVLFTFGDASRLKKNLQIDFHSSGHKIKVEGHRSTSGATEASEGPQGPLSLEECKELLEITNGMLRELRMVGMLKATLNVRKVPKEQIDAGMAQLAALREEGEVSLPKPSEVRPWDGNFADERTIRYYKMKQFKQQLPAIQSRIVKDRVYLEANMEKKAIECIPILLLLVTMDLNENFLLPYTKHGETPYTPEQQKACGDLFPNVRYE